MLYAANYWLNMFPRKGGISQTMSPCTLLTGLTMNYNRICRLEFGKYVQTHEEHDNSLNPCTIGALALRRTGNIQGGYFFFSLTTGKVINQMCWTTIPMPKEVIHWVERMARQEHTGTTLLLKDRGHNEIINLDHEDDDDDSDYEPDNDDDDKNDDDDDNNVPINQPNEPYDDPGTLGEQHAQQDKNEENNNENDIANDSNNNDGNENGNDNTHDEDEYVEPTDVNDTASENVNAEETEETTDHNPGGITGVEPLPPIQVQNE